MSRSTEQATLPGTGTGASPISIDDRDGDSMRDRSPECKRDSGKNPKEGRKRDRIDRDMNGQIGYAGVWRSLVRQPGESFRTSPLASSTRSEAARGQGDPPEESA